METARQRLGTTSRARSDGTERPADLLRVQRDDAYLAQLRAEAEWWDTNPDPFTSMTLPPDIQRHENERLAGDPGRTWYETIDDYGRFKHGCILGAGPGIIEGHLLREHPELHLTVVDISRDSLERLRARVCEEFPDRLEVREEDLNFVELQANSFDLVVSQACLHHIVNLEHVAFQVNRSLTEHGLFFVRDAVCESLFQFSAEKKRLFETSLGATAGGRERSVRWPDRSNWQFSPFESVRSGEILHVLRCYLNEVSVRTANSLLMLNLFTQKKPLPSPKAQIERAGFFSRLRRAAGRRLARLRRPVQGPPSSEAPVLTVDPLLLMLDDVICDTGYLEPGIAFGVYRKWGTSE